MSDHATEVMAQAVHYEHEWDRKAVDWPLTTNSVVVEVGGFRGRWALQMARRYWPKLYVYEPQPWAAAVCREVLKPYGASVFGFGLGVRDDTLAMGDWETDGCSFVKDGAHLAQIRDAATALPKAIDLMLINIEGGEYTLIPYLLEKDIHPRYLVVQMHNFAGDSDQLRAKLAEHYDLLWDYGDILSAWGRR